MSLAVPTPAGFFARLLWIDGRPLLETMEPYRLALFEQAFTAADAEGRRKYNLVLKGVAKKNWKSTDLDLAALYSLLMVESAYGNDCYIIANDEDQASDDLDLAKKLVAVNPALQAEVDVLAKEIVRKDGRGRLRILPARDVLGMHGKTYLFLGIDEMHGYRDYGVLEALAPDPHRGGEYLIWITSYASIYHREGAPLHDYFQRGRRGDDPRMLFSWYSADYCTDAAFDTLSPEQRANPSMACWSSADYLEQQRKRLPAHKFRRLHLNLPGMPDGAYFDPNKVSDCVESGVRQRAPEPNRRYYAYVDMSGGSQDDAVLAIAYHDGRRAVIAAVVSQTQKPPFDPRLAVEKFAGVLAQYNCHAVTGDAYAGQTFRADFSTRFAVRYLVSPLTKHELYEEFEPVLNSREVALLDDSRVTEQLLGLCVRGMKIDHLPGEHDDFANAVAGVTWLACQRATASVDDSPDVSHARTDYNPLTRDEDNARSRANVDPRPPWAQPVLYLSE